MPVRSSAGGSTSCARPLPTRRRSTASYGRSAPAASRERHSPSGSTKTAGSAWSSSKERCRSPRFLPGRSPTGSWRRSRGSSTRSTTPPRRQWSPVGGGVTNWPTRTGGRSSATTTSAWRTSSSATARRSDYWTSNSPHPVDHASTSPPSPGCAFPSTTRSTRPVSDGRRPTARPDCGWWPTPTAWTQGGSRTPRPPRPVHARGRHVRAASRRFRGSELHPHAGRHGWHGALRPEAPLVGLEPATLRRHSPLTLHRLPGSDGEAAPPRGRLSTSALSPSTSHDQPGGIPPPSRRPYDTTIARVMVPTLDELPVVALPVA